MMGPLDHDPLNPGYSGPLRIDGKYPYNSHWWAEGDNCWRLLTRAEHHLLGVVPLNNGAWLAGFCPATYDRQYPDRAAAIRAMAADFLREIRWRRRDRIRIQRGLRLPTGSLGQITEVEEYRARAWLYRILRREVGSRSRWARLSVVYKARQYEQQAAFEVTWLARSLMDWAQRSVGRPAGKGKRAEVEHADRVAARLDTLRQEKAVEIALQYVRLSRCIARTDRIRCA